MRSAPALTALLLAVALLAGCTTSSADSSSGVFGGSVVIGLPQIGTLDPPRAVGQSALSLLRTACDGLVGLEPGSRRPRPALAESWSLSSVSRLLTVRLRDGLEFQDGTPVTSAAIREALSRVARPATDSPWTNLVAKIDGYEEVVAGEATHLSGVRVTDETTFEVRLTVPASEFPTVLSHPALTPVSLDSVRADPEGAELPVCAGPYRIERGSDGKDFRLGKVPHYTSRNDAFLNSGAGEAEVILVRAFDSPEDAYQAFRSDEVDIAPVPESRLAEAQALRGGLHGGSTPEVHYLGFSPAPGATADPRLRQAISLAIDRLAIIQAVFGDDRAPAERWLQEDYAPGVATSCSEVVRRIAGPHRARRLLAETAIDPGSIELPLHYSEQGRERLVAEAIQVQVEDALGLDVIPRAVRGQSVEEAFATGEPALWLLSTRVELPLPDQFLADPFRTGGSRNILGFSDPAFDDRVHAAERTSSPDEVARLYVEAESILCDLMPAIPLWRAVNQWLVNESAVVFEGDAILGSLGYPILRHARAAE